MFHLVRGSVYLLVVLGAYFRFLYTGLVTIFTYIVLYFSYMMMTYVFLHLPLHVLFLFSLYTHVSLCMQSFNFCFTLRCLDEFCLKCFRKIGCQSLSCRELSSCKVFQEFVVGIDLLCNTTSGYELSDL